MVKKAIWLLFYMVLVLNANTKSLSPKDIIIEHKIDSILKLMTLSEKIGQMNQLNGEGEKTGPIKEGASYIEEIKKGNVGSILNANGVEYTLRLQKIAVEQTRLHIPLIFGYDVIHGYKTIMPIPLAEACSWDLEAIEKSSRIAAIEASASGQHWTFAPMVDIMRDARWGRVMEGSGEDVLLGGQIAKARVKGFQGDDLSSNNSIVACAKHFAGYGFSESGRDYNTVDFSENTLRNIVLPPFKACVDAGVGTFMNSFNEIGGVPSTGNKHLQRDILKGEWGFDGFVVSDWASIWEMIPHGFAKDNKEAAFKAIKAGSDMDMESRAYVPFLEQLVKDGQVKEDLINDAVKRILRIKFRLGLFENPYKGCDLKKEKELLLSKEHIAFSREIGRKSIVLLKNNNSLLPLNKNSKNVALIGSLAADKDSPLGNWRGQGVKNSAVSLFEGLQSVLGNNIKYSEGYKLNVNSNQSFHNKLQIEESDRSGFSESIELAKKSETVIFAIGETAYQSGEGRAVTDIKPKGLQLELLKEILKVNKNVIVVVMSGRPMDLTEVVKAQSVIQSWHLGSQEGNALADVIFGDYNPSGKLAMSFPRSVGQLPIYYNFKNTGRPYTDSSQVLVSKYTDQDNSPLFSFGYGLSYTKFEYSNLKLSQTEIKKDGKLNINITIKNNGSFDGGEVVQLYTRDLVASVTRPVKELKAFQKIFLKKGESKEINFVIDAKDLAFYNADGEFQVETGGFKIFVGGNSQDLIEADFNVSE